MIYEFRTVDVFTSDRFGGNPLAVFPRAEGLDPQTMQALAAEMNLSETTFVLPPWDPMNTAQVRIFNKTSEMAFAGHPLIGTAFVLGRDDGPDELAFEVPAGLVRVRLRRDADGKAKGCRIEAPQPLKLEARVTAEAVCACLGIHVREVTTSGHVPVVASMGNPFVIAEVTPAALSRATPDMQAFRRAQSDYPHPTGRFAVYAYARAADQLRARMFAPLADTWEDPATGSAAAPLAGLLLSLSSEERATISIAQGLEMGRPSLLLTEAWRTPAGILATVEGRCVPIFEGRIDLT